MGRQGTDPVGVEIEGVAVHTGTGRLGGVRGPPALAVKGELKGRKEEMPKVGREGNMASSEGGNEVIFTGTDCPFGRTGLCDHSEGHILP